MTPRELERAFKLLELRISAACERCHRTREDVSIVAASKLQPIEVLRDLYDLGQRDFGENRVQELLKKREKMPPDVRWHLIGHLQSNKARQIAEFIDTVHSIDSFEMASELARRAVQHGHTVNVLVEVNVSAEESKNGVDPDEAGVLVSQIATECQGLLVTGLMGMASFEEDPERTRPQFERLYRLRSEIMERQPELNAFRELSMGMSNDFEVAIEEGATMIRIGSALFGERH